MKQDEIKSLLLKILEELHHIRESRGIVKMPKVIPENHFCAFVQYDDLMFNEDFVKSFKNVSLAYHQEWEKHWLVDADETPQDRLFFVKSFGQYQLDSDQVFTWCSTHGYRPATHTEALVFAQQFPHVQQISDVVSLGDHCVVGGEYHVSVLTKEGLGNARLVDKWGMNNSFLLVKM